MSSSGTWPPTRWHYRRSLASRVAVLTTVTLGITIAILALTAYLVMRQQLMSSLDQSLLNRAHKAAAFSDLRDATAQGTPAWVLGAADVRIIFLNAEGRGMAGDHIPNFTVGRPELEVAAGDRDWSVRTLVTAEGERFRVATVPSPGGPALMLAQPLAPNDRTLEKLGGVLFTFGALGVLTALMVGWLVARNGLRPVRRLTSAVEHIAVTEDLTPLRVEGDDEVARLATAFNQMLLALAASRDRQRRLVADASHELRTPLTSLRTNLDLLRQAEGNSALPPETRLELLDDVRGQIEELSALVGDLVELARDEPTTRVVAEVDLADVVERAVTRVRRRAHGVSFDVDLAAWRVVGDSNGLERALTNLLDNAAKWSPPDGTVTVRLADGVLTVDDEGSGVAETDRPHVFERFYRAEESRAMPGSGLGLAIVRQVIDRHGGQVEVSDAPGGGARFVVSLPGVAGVESVGAAGSLESPDIR
ncbi:HAMP domain-containing histidine kinase [Nocardioides sp. zg-1308]|uniref:HAMP domain-containing sensor histidine kinase n=1 Tax=Nocardioides TaxID=1839 RepID=UPI00155553C7|nr:MULTISPECIES: HAMP domain-containing sensor histidine kinase [unclassified Nocardioides]NPD04261.1 HAMP domain-containing histidine kinase [Nocardioides sp. zg-1308]WQQ22144.1 HAMP domain-containing sensor histidine kinase [Nocardioides sp. S-34]